MMMMMIIIVLLLLPMTAHKDCIIQCVVTSKSSSSLRQSWIKTIGNSLSIFSAWPIRVPPFNHLSFSKNGTFLGILYRSCNLRQNYLEYCILYDSRAVNYGRRALIMLHINVIISVHVSLLMYRC